MSQALRHRVSGALREVAGAAQTGSNRKRKVGEKVIALSNGSEIPVMAKRKDAGLGTGPFKEETSSPVNKHLRWRCEYKVLGRGPDEEDHTTPLTFTMTVDI